MKTPRFLLGAAVLFWGVQSGRLALAVPMAIALEGWHWTAARWEIAPIGFQRVADVCTWTFLIAAGYLTFSLGMPVPVLRILEWLPVMVAPLVLAQLYSTAGRIELAALFTSLRGARGSRWARVQVDLAPAYAVVCALAAGAANHRTPAYFGGVTLLLLWALWTVRPPRAVGTWLAAAVLSVALGYAGHHGLAQLQAALVNYAIDYLNANLTRTDPYRASTDIGHIGELKNSDRILLRVSLAGETRTPLLLHRASYDVYTNATWLARDAPFEMLPGQEGARWVLAASEASGRAVTVSESFPQGRGVLALATGAVEIHGLAGADMKRNRLGTVQVERQPGIARYAMEVADAAYARDAPGAYDLRVPATEAAAVEDLVSRLGLRTMNATDALEVLKHHFDRSFRYSTYRAGRARESTPLADFLLRTKSGHCEYFATATVLIARAIGIPARYGTGFSVQEWSELEQSYVVRERHAHAWARVHLDGAWRDFDTTPPQWFVEEAQQASAWEPLRDLWAWLEWEIGIWRAGEGERSVPGWLLALVVPLVAVLAWRVHRAGGFVRRHAAVAHIDERTRQGADSPFYRIEAHLAALGCARMPHEPSGEWIDRAARALIGLEVEPLRRLLELHYRYRFDPEGLDDSGRDALAAGVTQWLGAARSLAQRGV